MERVSKRERKRWNYYSAGATGRIQWTARGVETCIQHLEKRWLSRKDNANWNPYIEAFGFIRDRYGVVRGTPHYLRMGMVILFMERHMKRLKRDKLIKPEGDVTGVWDDALFEAFAKLPFKPPKGFTYAQVRDYVRRTKKPN